jgi:hypothetical protein
MYIDVQGPKEESLSRNSTAPVYDIWKDCRINHSGFGILKSTSKKILRLK